MTDCPLVLYVTDEEGLRSGIASDGIYYELDDVLFSAFPLQDGTAYTELIYPLGAGYRLVMEGTGEGQAYVLVQDWVDFERDGQGVALYQLTVTEGALYESMIPKDELSWDGRIDTTRIAGNRNRSNLAQSTPGAGGCWRNTKRGLIASRLVAGLEGDVSGWIYRIVAGVGRFGGAWRVDRPCYYFKASSQEQAWIGYQQR